VALASLPGRGIFPAMRKINQLRILYKQKHNEK